MPLHLTSHHPTLPLTPCPFTPSCSLAPSTPSYFTSHHHNHPPTHALPCPFTPSLLPPSLFPLSSTQPSHHPTLPHTPLYLHTILLAPSLLSYYPLPPQPTPLYSPLSCTFMPFCSPIPFFLLHSTPPNPPSPLPCPTHPINLLPPSPAPSPYPIISRPVLSWYVMFCSVPVLFCSAPFLFYSCPAPLCPVFGVQRF